MMDDDLKKVMSTAGMMSYTATDPKCLSLCAKLKIRGLVRTTHKEGLKTTTITGFSRMNTLG